MSGHIVPLHSLAAAAVLLVAGGIAFVERGSHDPAVATTLDTTVAAVEPPLTGAVEAAESPLTAAVEAASAFVEPSAEEVALAGTTIYHWDSAPTQVSSAGGFASLLCEPAACSSGRWAYVTGSVGGGEVYRGTLPGEDVPALSVLDDRLFVAMQMLTGRAGSADRLGDLLGHRPAC